MNVSWILTSTIMHIDKIFGIQIYWSIDATETVVALYYLAGRISLHN